MSMEISAAEDREATAAEGKEDTPATAPSVPTIPHSSDAVADESHLENPAQDQTQSYKSVGKGKGIVKDKDQKKHGVMALPAEIRETYAFQWSA